MKNITFVTSNPNKAREVESILGTDNLAMRSLEVSEIQSFSLEEIVRAKAEEAQRQMNEAVLVEDIAIDLPVLKGFPGPCVKFWEKVGGHDAAVEIAEKLGDARATVRCGVGYADGDQFLYVEGKVDGTFVAKRGDEGWGFDFYFVPQGETQTYSEMGPDAKNLISHRRKGWELMRSVLRERGILE